MVTDIGGLGSCHRSCVTREPFMDVLLPTESVSTTRTSLGWTPLSGLLCNESFSCTVRECLSYSLSQTTPL